MAEIKKNYRPTLLYTIISHVLGMLSAMFSCFRILQLTLETNAFMIITDAVYHSILTGKEA